MKRLELWNIDQHIISIKICRIKTNLMWLTINISKTSTYSLKCYKYDSETNKIEFTSLQQQNGETKEWRSKNFWGVISSQKSTCVCFLFGKPRVRTFRPSQQYCLFRRKCVVSILWLSTDVAVTPPSLSSD
jgi:hypothetical protein